MDGRWERTIIIYYYGRKVGEDYNYILLWTEGGRTIIIYYYRRRVGEDYNYILL